MQVKELCRRQLLAKTSAAAANEKCTVMNQALSGSGRSPSMPATPSPLASPANITQSPLASPANITPSPGSVQQRSPAVEKHVRYPDVDSLRPADAATAKPSLLKWHAPAASCSASVDDNVNTSTRPSSNSTDSSDGNASHQFAVVSLTTIYKCLSSLSFEHFVRNYTGRG